MYGVCLDDQVNTVIVSRPLTEKINSTLDPWYTKLPIPWVLTKVDSLQTISMLEKLVNKPNSKDQVASFLVCRDLIKLDEEVVKYMEAKEKAKKEAEKLDSELAHLNGLRSCIKDEFGI